MDSLGFQQEADIPFKCSDSEGLVGARCLLHHVCCKMFVTSCPLGNLREIVYLCVNKCAYHSAYIHTVTVAQDMEAGDVMRFCTGVKWDICSTSVIILIQDHF